MRGLTIAVFLAFILVVSSFHEEDKAMSILKKILHAVYPDNHHDDHEHQDHDDQEQHYHHDHLDHDYDHHDDCDHDYDHHGGHRHEDHYPNNSANYNPNHPLSNVKESPAPVSGQNHPQPGYGETPATPLGVSKGMLGGGHDVTPVKEPLHPVHGHVGVINMPLEVTTGMARGNFSHEKIVYHH